MKKEFPRGRLVIEGCFDLFHDDHRAFITRCIRQFRETYGAMPAIRVRVMSNEWAHKKGVLRPFIDIQDRIKAVTKYLTPYADQVVIEATKASFEYQDQATFEEEFADTMIAIPREKMNQVPFPDSPYMAVEPLNRIHTSDIEKAIYSKRDSSCCAVRKVGAILVERGHILSRGNNTCRCSHTDTCIGCAAFLKGKIAESRKLGCEGLHAEASALSTITAGRDNKAAVLLTTTAPCDGCARRIVEAGIKTVIYFDEWKRLSPDRKTFYIETSGLDLLRMNGVTVKKAGIP